MLPFANPLTNEDPLAKVRELEELRRHWYIAFFLIASNLFYIFGAVFCWRIAFVFEAMGFIVAMVISMGYHGCQTTGYCFHYDLVDWTFLDHNSAPMLAAVIIVMTVNSRSLTQLLQRHRIEWDRLMRTLRVRRSEAAWPQGGGPKDVAEPHLVISLGGAAAEGNPTSYYYTALYKEENAIYDAWSAGIVYVYFFVVLMATTAHPFSMQAFLIVIAFGLGVILLKIVYIDGGCPEPVLARLSVPDLITGLVLTAAGLVFFVLDSWIYYWQFHSLWHMFSALGLYFYAAGVTRGTAYHHSPLGNLVARYREKRRATRAKREEAKAAIAAKSRAFYL